MENTLTWTWSTCCYIKLQKKDWYSNKFPKKESETQPPPTDSIFNPKHDIKLEWNELTEKQRMKNLFQRIRARRRFVDDA